MYFSQMEGHAIQWHVDNAYRADVQEQTDNETDYTGFQTAGLLCRWAAGSKLLTVLDGLAIEDGVDVHLRRQ